MYRSYVKGVYSGTAYREQELWQLYQLKTDGQETRHHFTSLSGFRPGYTHLVDSLPVVSYLARLSPSPASLLGNSTIPFPTENILSSRPVVGYHGNSAKVGVGPRCDF